MRAMVKPRTRLQVGVSVRASQLSTMTRVGVRTRARTSVSKRDSASRIGSCYCRRATTARNWLFGADWRGSSQCNQAADAARTCESRRTLRWLCCETLRCGAARSAARRTVCGCAWIAATLAAAGGRGCPPWAAATHVTTTSPPARSTAPSASMLCPSSCTAKPATESARPATVTYCPRLHGSRRCGKRCPRSRCCRRAARRASTARRVASGPPAHWAAPASPT